MYEMHLSAETRDGGVVITIDGDLDLVTCAQLDECLTRVSREHSHVILDMTAVDFLDTSALAVIVSHWKTMEAAGGVLALAAAQYRGARALWITGLADRLPMYETVQQAFDAVSERPM
jgi:anti-sigma B factor antagonist